MDQPRLKAHFGTEVVDSRVFLLAEDRYFFVTGPDAVKLLPYLDGRHSVGDIVQALAADVPFPRVLAALRRYAMAGHLAEGRPDLPDEALAYWDALGVDPVAIAAAAGTTVGMLSGAGLDTGPFRAEFEAQGLTVVDAANPDGLTVLVVDDYLDPMLPAVNDERLASGNPWLLARPAGLSAWMGPLLVPGATGCWQCLAQRVSENRQVERYLSHKRGEAMPRYPARAAAAAGPATAAAVLAAEAVRFLATGSSDLVGRMTTFDLRALKTEEHALVRRPQCSACGDPELTASRAAKIVLAPGAARHTTDGGYRVDTPLQTFERLKHHISPYLGAVSWLGAHEDDTPGVIHAYSAGHNFAMVNDNMDLLRRNMRGQSGGKGRSEIQAKVSAVCEAIERYSAVWRGDEPVVRGTYADLDPTVALHPADVLLFSDTQYENRHEWNHDPMHQIHLVPERFREDLELEWTPAWSLTTDSERLVPAGLVWFGHPDLAKHFYCVGDSNGSASGNTLEEAILQGFCELVERDAVALWWYNRLRVPAFDLDSLEDPYIEILRRHYAGLGRTFWMLDITGDLGIPTFAAVSQRDHEVQDLMVGFGAHPDARIAAIRALTELNQFLPFVGRRDADGNTQYLTDDPGTLKWLREARLEDEQWLVGASDHPASTIGSFPPVPTDDLAEQVRDCVARAEAAGVEVLAVDQSRPDLDLAVAKVFAPGLRHFWRRLGPGRIYDVPVERGLLEAATLEERMNPWNVFF